MWARVSSKLLVGAMLLTSCTQGSPDVPGAAGTPVSPAPTVTPDQPNREKTEATPAPKPSPIPLKTADVPDPHNVSLYRFAPADARIVHVRPIAESGGAPAQLVLTWARGGDESVPDEIGLLLWQYTGGLQVSWKVVYLVHDRPLAGVMRAGPPGGLRRARADIGVVSRIAVAVGDLTGDGHSDVLAVEQGSGTAGCSLFRALANEGKRVRQIRFEEACETSMSITKEGLLEIEEATYGKGCQNIHGCGRRIRLLRWNGAEWEQISSREAPL